MRKTIHIHIGAHRTGTTAAQTTLDAHRQMLAVAGYLYPKSCLLNHAQHRLAKAMRGRRDNSQDDEPDFDTEISALLAEIATAPQASVIISSEGFFSARQPQIERLASHLAGFDVRIAAVIRRPDEMFRSICGYRAKRPAMAFAGGYEKYLADPHRLSKDLDFAGALARWSNVFGRQALAVAYYESERDSATLLARLIGLPAGVLAGPGVRRNDSLSATATALMLAAKTAGLSKRQLELVLTAAVARHPLDAERASLLSPDDRMAILRACAAGTDAAFATYLGGENLYHPSRFSEADFPPKAELSPDDLALIRP